jgi:hypothetical protein
MNKPLLVFAVVILQSDDFHGTGRRIFARGSDAMVGRERIRVR